MNELDDNQFDRKETGELKQMLMDYWGIKDDTKETKELNKKIKELCGDRIDNTVKYKMLELYKEKFEYDELSYQELNIKITMFISSQLLSIANSLSDINLKLKK
jgi:hypothetical protein